jgi:hypothetical protein
VIVADDTVTTGELSRSIAELKLMVGGLISRDVYAADQRAAGYRFSEFAADIQDLRNQHNEDVKALHDRITDQGKAFNEQIAKDRQRAEDNRVNWRGHLLTGVLPALVALAGVLVTIYVKQHGG